jgi:predicted DNA-binding WGR domain protein
MYDPTHWHTERWEKGSRYYRAEIRQDLFGGWQLVRTWGRKHTRLGRSVARDTASHADALAQLARVATRRQQRGYVKRENA